VPKTTTKKDETTVEFIHPTLGDLQPWIDKEVTITRKAGKGEPATGRLALVNEGAVVLHTQQDGNLNPIGIYLEDIAAASLVLPVDDAPVADGS
jgi:hypothetical protein